MPRDIRTRPHRSMRSLSGLAVAMVIVAAACGGTGSHDVAARSTASVAASPGAGDVAFALFDGSQTSLAAFAGTPVVINFWASWCPSCVAEMSSAFRPVAEDLDGEVTFIGINIQDERSRALALLDETGVEWINAVDPDGVLYARLGGLGMPFTVFVDAGGSVVDTHNGPLDEGLLRAAIAEAVTR